MSIILPKNVIQIVLGNDNNQAYSIIVGNKQHKLQNLDKHTNMKCYFLHLYRSIRPPPCHPPAILLVSMMLRSEQSSPGCKGNVQEIWGKAYCDLSTTSLLIFEIAAKPVNVNVQVTFFLKVFSE
jgi:hypothetical protein